VDEDPVLLSLGLLVLIAFGFQLYRKITRPSRAEYAVRIRRMGEQRIIAEFQRQRGKGMRIFAVLVALVVLPLLGLMAWLRFYGPVIVLGGIVGVIGSGWVALIWGNRCPVCAEVVQDEDGDGASFNGLRADPESCPTCGARLKSR
jgi:hypothetical protein